jgi:vitamin B12 transporter
MFNVHKALRAPGLRSACAVACGLMLSGAMPGVAVAEDRLDPLVVTATRTPQPLSKVMADVTIIGRQAIERQVSGNVGDLLRTVPGLEITRTGDAASVTSVLIRGSNSRHVLVLVDGIPTDTQGTGGATWETIPLQWVDRIEVVRGPASVAYGSDAMGGVVQIFTRKGRGAPHIEAGVGLADQSLLSFDFSLMGAVDEWDYALGVAAEVSDGFNALLTAQPGSAAADRDGHESNSSHLKLGWSPVRDHKLQLALTRQHLNNKFDASKTSTFDDRAIKDSSHAALSWSAQWSPMWHTSAALGQTTDAYESRTDYPYETRTRVQTASVVNRLQMDEHALRLILERREDQLLNSDLPVLGDAGRGDQASNGLGLGYEWQSDALGVSATWRQDRNDRFGDHRSGALAGSWQFMPGQRLRASVGTAFRSPTLYQLFSTYGNVNLEPESSRTTELAYSFEAEGQRASVTAFRTHYDQLIDFGPIGVCLDTDPDYGGCYRNTARARIQGVSFAADVSIMELRLIASLDLLDPQNSDTGKRLARRAKQAAKLRAEWPWGAWQIGAQVLMQGRRYEDNSNTKPMGTYALYGLDASRRFAPAWSVVARVDNVSDHAYQTALNYASAPRTVFVGVRWAPAN